MVSFKARKPINWNIFTFLVFNMPSYKPSKAARNTFFKKSRKPYPPLWAAFFQGKIGVVGTFFPDGNYFPNPWKMLKISHNKKREEYMSHTKSQPVFFFFFFSQYQLSRRSRSDSNCFTVTWRKKKPRGSHRISYFSEDLHAGMQIKQQDAEDFFLFYSFFFRSTFTWCQGRSCKSVESADSLESFSMIRA